MSLDDVMSGIENDNGWLVGEAFDNDDDRCHVLDLKGYLEAHLLTFEGMWTNSTSITPLGSGFFGVWDMSKPDPPHSIWVVYLTSANDRFDGHSVMFMAEEISNYYDLNTDGLFWHDSRVYKSEPRPGGYCEVKVISGLDW